jgi:hypothetical protein
MYFMVINYVSQNDFAQSRAGPEAKDALVKAVFGRVPFALLLLR